ncbi:Exodeoxyribonuclease 7 large subunit [Spirochaeta thermophila DSM 6578]|uniref:Exodeoxyribonuclease 7 large subunit n=1 Tax=Winmispira thermophila (strain ATCC 700085 / DSM 6578 / Z-1203) TaxID=869211 RepID=G0GCW5_WINT7|nr:exodeoxyribonuclease VII large subunit [Spirochaeta thermophila]AEJ61257.1 Exodeoxyribonuclease 7 large subunit [Spirochaeta thermophila DSM 6578]
MSIPQKVFSVSEITSLIKGYLEDAFPYVAVQGEISNCRPSSTGHLYFSLKDERAVLNVVMFQSRYRRLSFQPKDGMMVLAKGALSVYEARGAYQLVCEELEQVGVGALLEMLEKRKQKLAAEGLFDKERKRPIPLFPSRIAVVTSPTGAAVRDIINVLTRRNAGVDIVVVPAPVQGENAAPIIAEQIRRADAWKLGDVIIVARGGGSIEDLLPFSEEVVVRAIAACETPVISAVGHEIDYTLSDFAADLRAPTPSAAAEMVSAHREELLQRVHHAHLTMVREIRSLCERLRFRLGKVSEEQLARLFTLYRAPYLQRWDEAHQSIVRTMREYLLKLRHRIEMAREITQAHSPRAVLSRGYAIVRDAATGDILRDTRAAFEGQRLSITLARGELEARTTQVAPPEDESATTEVHDA